MIISFKISDKNNVCSEFFVLRRYREYIANGMEDNKMSDKLKVGILGATGMVGQRFISLLENHPWFEVVTVPAHVVQARLTKRQLVTVGRWIHRCRKRLRSWSYTM